MKKNWRNGADFAGVLTALVTPFKQGEVDFQSLKRLLRWQLDGGINGLVVNGTTAESPTLSTAEQKAIFEFVNAEVAGQIPLVMGTGSNSTSAAISATRQAQEIGADAALVVVPYYNRPPQRGLFQHFQKISECSDLPIILYNVPSRTSCRLELDTIVELSRLPKIIAIKEASGDLEFGKQISEQTRTEFLLTSGDDATFLDLIRYGGAGVISVASNLMPKEFVDWCARARTGDNGPRDEFMKINDLNAFLYVDSNPIPIKAALYLKGLIASPELRLPLVQISERNMSEMKVKLQAAELL